MSFSVSAEEVTKKEENEIKYVCHRDLQSGQHYQLWDRKRIIHLKKDIVRIANTEVEYRDSNGWELIRNRFDTKYREGIGPKTPISYGNLSFQALARNAILVSNTDSDFSNEHLLIYREGKKDEENRERNIVTSLAVVDSEGTIKNNTIYEHLNAQIKKTYKHPKTGNFIKEDTVFQKTRKKGPCKIVTLINPSSPLKNNKLTREEWSPLHGPRTLKPRLASDASAPTEEWGAKTHPQTAPSQPILEGWAPETK